MTRNLKIIISIALIASIFLSSAAKDKSQKQAKEEILAEVDTALTKGIVLVKQKQILIDTVKFTAKTPDSIKLKYLQSLDYFDTLYIGKNKIVLIPRSVNRKLEEKTLIDTTTIKK